jgi:hypothetical protein
VPLAQPCSVCEAELLEVALWSVVDGLCAVEFWSG